MCKDKIRSTAHCVSCSGIDPYAVRSAHVMLSKNFLDQAKAFLCWDILTDLTIKLVPLNEHPAAFYYPPSERYNTIVVFYPEHNHDFTSPLFLLFHEAGHCLQFQGYHEQGQVDRFWEDVNAVDGIEKARFEKESWERGAILLKEFLERSGISAQPILSQYRLYAEQCVETYFRPD